MTLQQLKEKLIERHEDARINKITSLLDLNERKYHFGIQQEIEWFMKQIDTVIQSQNKAIRQDVASKNC